MAKAKVVFQDPPAPQRHQRGRWVEILNEVLKRPNRWALIHTAETASQAQGAVSNLNQRVVHIPRPDDEWQFLSRDNEVYAIYRGKSRASVRRAK